MSTKNITARIDGISVHAPEGTTVLQAALDAGIYIPHICYHPDLDPMGVCRLCMVAIEGRRMTAACTTPLEEGMVVTTEDAEVNRIRKASVKLLLAHHHTDCHSCKRNTKCELQKIARYMDVTDEEMKQLRLSEEKMIQDNSNPFFDRDFDKCIMCGICIRTCEDIVGVDAIEFMNRGFTTTVGTFGDSPIKESVCVSCGECVARCPVAALVPKHMEEPSREVKTVCTYCGCGCGIIFGIRGDKIVSARGETDNPSNLGNLCVKGRYGYDFVNSPDRLTVPLIRKDGELQEATWDEALDLVAEKLGQARGKTAVLASAKCTNEDNYVIQKLSRAVLGTNNVDHCARLCHAPTVTGLVSTFGSGAMTNSIRGIGDASCIFAIGTNTSWAHPIIGIEVVRSVKKGGKLIVANPKQIDLARHADLIIQQKPGSDVALLMGMVRVIIDEGLQDTEFINERCEQYEELQQALQAFTPERVSELTGVDFELIKKAARMYAENNPASILYSMGITQHTHGTDNVKAVANLAMVTGNIGKASSGVNPLRGQNNVQGACDMGALPNVYPGYQLVNNPEIQDKFEKAWKAELDPQPGITHTEMFDGMLDGRITAMYQVGENPVISEANAGHVMEALEKIDFFVVQDIFLTESAKYADVVLPAASFAEKNGTFTNTERRVQRVRRALAPIGQSRPDWLITCQIAQRLGVDGFTFNSPDEIMDEIASIAPIYGGISFKRIQETGLQWPCLDAEHPGTPYLHGEQFKTPSGKGVFQPLEYRAPAEEPDDDYPLILTTDRSLYHFHTSSMTGRVKGLMELHGYESVLIHPEDAQPLNISTGDIISVTSRRGTIEAAALVSDAIKAGVISMTFHFPEVHTNLITSSALDPIAKIPETKVAAVAVERK